MTINWSDHEGIKVVFRVGYRMLADSVGVSALEVSGSSPAAESSVSSFSLSTYRRSSLTYPAYQRALRRAGARARHARVGRGALASS